MRPWLLLSAMLVPGAAAAGHDVSLGVTAVTLTNGGVYNVTTPRFGLDAAYAYELDNWRFGGGLRWAPSGQGNLPVEVYARALLTTQLISDLRRTRERFARILEVLGEAVTVQAADGRMVYANTAAARLVGCATPEELLATSATELTERFEITDADGAPIRFEDLPAHRLLAGLDAPPLLTRSRHRATGAVLWLLTKATLLDDGGERLAVNIIEDVTASR